MTIEVPLSQGLIAVIDAADEALIAPYKWCASVGKWATYAVANYVKPDGRRSMLKMHRVIMGAVPGQLVDHRNHNGLDNQRSNLRLCGTSQNGANARRSRRNSTGYRGVGWHKQAGKWRAYIEVDKKLRHLGLFDDPWEAAQAYNAAAREAWGEFAYQNERIVTELLGGISLKKAA
jgi:AP2 domain